MSVFLLVLTLLFSTSADDNKFFWGKTGHRVVGEIATVHLTPEAKKQVERVLGHTSLAIAGTWMDEVRSNPKYDYMTDWHWVTIPNGMTYKETEKNPNGDLIKALQTTITELKTGDLSAQEEEERLKILVHLVGDIHQPLHVGTGHDRGGNATEVEWFYEPSNLHRVWDSHMIDDTKLSYTEFANAINHPTEKQLQSWQQTEVLDWAKEAIALREQIYDLPADKQLSYKYQYKQSDVLELQLLKGGIRLAKVLNEIYD
jgi:hypothetical protein